MSGDLGVTAPLDPIGAVPNVVPMGEVDIHFTCSFQDDSYVDSYISTIGVDFVSLYYIYLCFLLLLFLLPSFFYIIHLNLGASFRKLGLWSRMGRPLSFKL